MYKHIVLDFDGTLVDSSELIHKNFYFMAEKYNFKKFDRNDYKILHKLPLKKRIGLIIFTLRAGREFKEMYYKNMDTLRTFDGMEELLAKLKASNYTVSIISSNTMKNLTGYLKAKGIKNIDNIISSKGLQGKGNSLKNYIKKYKLSKRDLVYIGDELRDIRACKKADVDMIAVSWGIDDKESLKMENPKYIVDKPEDIWEVIVNKK